MQKSGLSILTVINNSPDMTKVSSLTMRPEIDAIFFWPFADYSSGKGKILWKNQKPIISARFNLWDGTFENPQSLANKLNKLSTDIHSVDGYSLVAVHVWTDSVTSVVQTIQSLSASVQVVAPDQFVQLIVENIGH